MADSDIDWRRELWLLRRLRKDIVAVGVTSTAQRAELVRDELTRLGWMEKTAGKREGKVVTFGEVFESVYGYDAI